MTMLTSTSAHNGHNAKATNDSDSPPCIERNSPAKPLSSVTLASDNKCDLACWAATLESSLLDRYQDLPNRTKADDDILHICSDLKRPVKDDARLSHMLNEIGLLLHTRYETLNRPEDPDEDFTYDAGQYLDDAIEAKRRAIAFTPHDSPIRLQNCWSLGRSLYARFSSRIGKSQDLQDIGDDIAITRWALQFDPVWHPCIPTRYEQLAVSLRACFQRLGNLQDLEHGIRAARRAMELTPEGHEEKLRRMIILGRSLYDRYRRLGHPDDLKDAISQVRWALDIVQDHRPSFPVALESLGTFLYGRYTRFGDLKILETAISVQKRALEATPEGHPDRLTFISSLTISLHARFQCLGDPGDIEYAISLNEEAANLVREGHPELLIRLDTDGYLKHSRFERFGDLLDLESAMSAKHIAAVCTPEDHPEKPGRLDSLGVSLHARFERLGEIEDLQDAIRKKERAVELAPAGHIDRPSHLYSLGISLLERFRRLGDAKDMERAISLQHVAINLTPDDHPAKAGHLDALGTSLHERYTRLDELVDLEEAISRKSRAIELTLDYHVRKPARLLNLSLSLRRQFKRSRALEDLRRNISVIRRAVELAPEDHPMKPVGLYELGAALEQLYRTIGDTQYLPDAQLSYEAAALHTYGTPSLRYQSAMRWVETSTETLGSGSDSSLSAHSCLMGVLSEVAWPGFTIRRRFDESAKFGTLIASAVSTAVAAGALPKAVEWLEQGRALIWSQVMSLRNPITELAEQHPERAEYFGILCRDLRQHSFNAPIRADNVERTAQEPVLSASDILRPYLVSYESCLKEIRGYPGFENFLRPSKSKDIMSRFAERATGPFVFINVHSSRCDAIALRSDGTLKPIELPMLKLQYALRMRDIWNSALRAYGVRSQRGPRGAMTAKRCGDKSNFELVLGRLWTWVVQPILTALDLLGDVRNTPLPCITWCPTGPLTQLPFHAAGIYTQGGPRAFDFVVSSYSPCISALHGRVDYPRSPRQAKANKMLLVTQERTPRPGLSPLPCVADESACLRAMLSTTEEHTFLEREEATVESVLSVVEQYPLVHFACHGSQNSSDPSRSAFELHDGPLPLSALMAKVANGGGLAFLSACQTATGDEKITEESMHLAAGMLAIGFRGVVATMWSIVDADAPIVVKAYYELLLPALQREGAKQGETGAAHALHEAVGRLREKVGEGSFERWVPFVHFGA